MVLRAHATRLMLLARAGVVLLLGVFVVFACTASTASAEEYGGLGSLGSFKAGTHGGHLEVNPGSKRAFGAAPDGSSYIAESGSTQRVDFRQSVTALRAGLCRILAAFWDPRGRVGRSVRAPRYGPRVLNVPPKMSIATIRAVQTARASRQAVLG